MLFEERKIKATNKQRNQLIKEKMLRLREKVKLFNLKGYGLQSEIKTIIDQKNKVCIKNL